MYRCGDDDGHTSDFVLRVYEEVHVDSSVSAAKKIAWCDKIARGQMTFSQTLILYGILGLTGVVRLWNQARQARQNAYTHGIP